MKGKIQCRVFLYLQDCYGQGKVREFFKKPGKIFDIFKVSEKSGKSVLWFIA